MSGPVEVLEAMGDAARILSVESKWPVDPTAEALGFAIKAVAELIEASQPFATFNSSLERIRIEVRTEDVKRLHAALARVKGESQ